MWELLLKGPLRSRHSRVRADPALLLLTCILPVQPEPEQQRHPHGLRWRRPRGPHFGAVPGQHRAPEALLLHARRDHPVPLGPCWARLREGAGLRRELRRWVVGGGGGRRQQWPHPNTGSLLPQYPPKSPSCPQALWRPARCLLPCPLTTPGPPRSASSSCPLGPECPSTPLRGWTGFHLPTLPEAASCGLSVTSQQPSQWLKGRNSVVRCWLRVPQGGGCFPFGRRGVPERLLLGPAGDPERLEDHVPHGAGAGGQDHLPV